MRLTSAQNAKDLIPDAYDIAVADCSGDTRTPLSWNNDTCFALKKTLVFGGQWTEFEGQLATRKPSDPRGQYPSYRCLGSGPAAPGTGAQNCLGDRFVLGAAARVMGSLAWPWKCSGEITGHGRRAGRQALDLGEALTGNQKPTGALGPLPARQRLCGPRLCPSLVSAALLNFWLTRTQLADNANFATTGNRCQPEIHYEDFPQGRRQGRLDAA